MRQTLSTVIVSAIAFLSVPPDTVTAQDFETGTAAYKAGDFARALKHFVPLAEQGHAGAQYHVGLMNEYGRGVARNDADALRWYRKSAAKHLANAQYRLGVLNENGWGLPRNPAKAATWYTKAAQQGHTFAQHDLAFMYMKGAGVSKDYVEAFKWLNIAVLHGNALMAKHLEVVRKKMTENEIARALKRVQAWIRQREQ